MRDVAACNNPHCRNGSVSTYWGTLVHPMYGSMKIDGEHDDPRIDCPGGEFYGGSSHQACGCRISCPPSSASGGTA